MQQAEFPGGFDWLKHPKMGNSIIETGKANRCHERSVHISTVGMTLTTHPGRLNWIFLLYTLVSSTLL